jgi:hypothetical protein
MAGWKLVQTIANADLAVVVATATLVDDSNNITSGRSVRSSS